MIRGGLFVMTTGQLSMPMCYANRLDTLDRVNNLADLAIQLQSCFHRSVIFADAIAYDRAFFGQGSTQMSIFMDNVACTGTESRLIDCTFDRHTADCSHSEDAGVRCQEGR